MDTSSTTPAESTRKFLGDSFQTLSPKEISSALYVWTSMLRRCFDSTNESYHRYGGRGITVCERWFVFSNFLADTWPRPEGLQLDRTDNNGNYEPSNCRWATRKEQLANSTRPNWFVVNGVRMHQDDMCRLAGVNSGTMSRRIARGIPIADVCDNARVKKVKLCLNQVNEIRALLKGGATCISLAKRYGVSHQSISLIKCGDTWRT